jgi:hypothetical protein
MSKGKVLILGSNAIRIEAQSGRREATGHRDTQGKAL